MEFSKTAATWKLQPEEVKLIRELFESRGYALLVEMEKVIKEGAMRDIEFSTDLHEITRAQGILRGFRLRDGSLRAIYDQSENEKEEEKESET